MAEMTKEVIVASCKANGGYAAPHLNDQLFLHCKGFAAIQNLEPYTVAKVLWLEQNALSELSGLEGQKDALVSLFVQNNFIRSMTTLTARLAGLRVLNVSHNYLTSLRGLAAACPYLETLQASHNQLTSLEMCEELWQLAGTLTSVDLSFNRIESSRAASDSPTTAAVAAMPLTVSAVAARGGSGAGGRHSDDDIRIVEVENAEAPAPAPAAALVPAAKGPAGESPMVLVDFFQRLPLVSVVYMQGNGLSHRLRNYRRNMILHLPTLTYLDERPVFPEERRVVEAWGRGGEDAEAAERAAIREEKREHLTQCVRVLTEQREGQRAVRDRLTQQFEQRRARELEELTQRRRRDRDDRAALAAAEDAAREVAERVEQDARWDLEDACRAAHATLAAGETAHRHAYEQRMAVADAAHAAAAAAEAQGVAEVSEAAAVRVLQDAGAESAPGTANFFFPPRRLSEGAAAVTPTTSATTTAQSAALAELLQSDDDILKEMESEIEHVLYDLSAATTAGKASSSSAARHTDPSLNSPAVEEADALPAAYSGRQVTDRTTLRMEKNVHAAVNHVAQQLKTEQRRRSSTSQREEVWQRFEQWEARRASVNAGQ